jgi:hypothetical protein
MAVSDGCQGRLEIGEGLNAVDLARFNQRGDAARFGALCLGP